MSRGHSHRAVTAEVDDLNRPEVVNWRQKGQPVSRAPAVAGLDKIKVHLCAPEIDDVCHAGVLDVGEPDALRVE
jgi:hypothetical protein